MHKSVQWKWEIGFAALPTMARLLIGAINPPNDLVHFFIEVFAGVEAFAFSFILYSTTFLSYIGRDEFSLRSESQAITFSLLFVGVIGTAFLMAMSAGANGDWGLSILAILMGVGAIVQCGRTRNQYKI